MIYLDYAATTPCDKRVVDAMLPYFTSNFGNPSSIHKYGEDALLALSDARQKVADLINAEFDEIAFTSGATESNNIVITRAVKEKQAISFKTEHKCIIDLFQRNNWLLLDVQSDGIVDLQKLEYAISDNVAIVSVCLVNNETGVLQNVAKIAEICHKHGVLLHTDATQGFGKIDIDVKALDIDFLSASAHKIYGPKGVGIIFYKKKYRKLLMQKFSNPDIEYGIRSGTVPMPLCVGFGKAAEIAKQEMHDDFERISRLRKLAISMTEDMDEVYVNGSETSFYPGILNISARGCEGEALMMEIGDVCVSSGSACTSNKLTISHVLDAMGIAPDIAQSSLRFSFGKYTTEDEVVTAMTNLKIAAEKLRKMSPIWEMIKKNMNIDEIFKNCPRHDH